jgi:DegT/DnrJ/EryC1/StrS aminotransferase family
VCELVDIGSYHDASLAGCSFWGWGDCAGLYL